MAAQVGAQPGASLPAEVPDRVLKIELDVWTIPGSPDERTAALNRAIQRLGEAPGVLQVSLAPDKLQAAMLSVRAEDRGSIRGKRARESRVLSSPATSLLGAPPRGETPCRPTPADDDHRQRSARSLWGSADPIGSTQADRADATRRTSSWPGYDRYFGRSRDDDRLPPRDRLVGARILVRTAVARHSRMLRRIARAGRPRRSASDDAHGIDAKMAEGTQISAWVGGVTPVLLLASIGLFASSRSRLPSGGARSAFAWPSARARRSGGSLLQDRREARRTRPAARTADQSRRHAITAAARRRGRELGFGAAELRAGRRGDRGRGARRCVGRDIDSRVARGDREPGHGASRGVRFDFP